MNEEHDDLLSALAKADPIDPDSVPFPNQQLFEEIVTMESGSETTTSRPSRSRMWVAASLVLVAGAGAGTYALNDSGSKAAKPKPTTTTVAQGKVRGIEPAPRTGAFGGASTASCIIWDVSSLDNSEFAFDGTVASIDNGWVSFDVNEWFKGEAGNLVVLNAEMLMAGPDGGVTTSVGEVLITEVGQRLLVSGSQGTAGVCNQTQAFTQSEADAWRDHLAG